MSCTASRAARALHAKLQPPCTRMRQGKQPRGHKIARACWSSGSRLPTNCR